jgi:hypothetical protein
LFYTEVVFDRILILQSHAKHQILPLISEAEYCRVQAKTSEDCLRPFLQGKDPVSERRLKPKRTGQSQSDQAAGKVNCGARENALGYEAREDALGQAVFDC